MAATKSKVHALVIGSVMEDINVRAALNDNAADLTWEHVKYYGGASSDAEIQMLLSPKARDAALIIGGGEATVDTWLLRAAPLVRVCTQMAVGYNGIDVGAAAAQGAWVANVPVPALREATADNALLLMLGACRHARRGLALTTTPSAAKGAGWDYKEMRSIIGDSPTGLTLGIIGFGRVGQSLAYKARAAFGMRVVFYDLIKRPAVQTPAHVRPYHEGRMERTAERAGDPLAGEVPAQWMPLEDLLRCADVVSLNCLFIPTGPHANGRMMGEPQFHKMKKGAYFINASRGGLVDEAALAAALLSGHLGAVGLDVYEDEPRVTAALAACPRAFLLPHTSSATRQCRAEMASGMIDNARRVLFEGLAPRYPLNAPAQRMAELDAAERQRVDAYLDNEFASAPPPWRPVATRASL